MLRKLTENRYERGSRWSRATDRVRNRSFRVSKPQNGPRGPPGAPWETSWVDFGALLGAPGPLLGRSWALLGLKMFPDFSKMYEKTRNLLSWKLLGCSWESPGRSELDFGPSEGRFCPSSGRFGGLPIGKFHRQTRAKSWQNPGEVLAKTIAHILSKPNE